MAGVSAGLVAKSTAGYCRIFWAMGWEKFRSTWRFRLVISKRCRVPSLPSIARVRKGRTEENVVYRNIFTAMR